MSVPGSYEREERSARILTYILAVVFYAAAYALARLVYGSLIGFLVCLPVLGAYGAWWLLHRGTGVRYWLRWLALRKVNGKYHAFDDLAVRIEWSEGRCWVAAQDVFEILGAKLDAPTVRRLATACGADGFVCDEHGAGWFEETALLRWLEKRGGRLDRRSNRFRLWLEREAFPPMHRKHHSPAG